MNESGRRTAERRVNNATRRLAWLGFAVHLVIGQSPAHAQGAANKPPLCPNIAGMIGGPLVATPDAARGIYIAVARSRGDPIHPSNKVVVDDDGDHWSVFQYPARSHRTRAGEVIVTAGGGTLDLQINKCDGSLLASYAK